MKLRRALHLVGAGALTGALLLGTAPTASADNIRDMQWALKAFHAKEIWQHSTGKGITVAVVDSGVDASHPDLRGQVLPGKDFTKEGGNPHDDLTSHGTGMAGLIAAKGHGPGGNDGVKGLAPGAKILPIRVKHHEDDLGVSMAAGIRYAVDHGAKVINISQGTGQDFRDKDAVEYAIAHDVVVVAAVGNSGEKETNYPAAYPGVVSVGGMNKQGGVYKDSSWGSNTTLLAPAVGNVLADPNAASGYAHATGTSNSSAFVSASAALVRAEFPKLTAGQVINRLIKTAKVPTGVGSNPKLPDPKFGYGIVRPLRAVTYDIPAGPKAGPLAQPAEGKPSSSAKASPPADQQPTSDDQSSSSSNTLVYVLIGLGVLVVLVIVVVLIAKKNKGGGNGPQGPGGGVPPMPQQGGQQHQVPMGQFGPPPPPNQPPQR